jgi:hypothetical protein
MEHLLLAYAAGLELSSILVSTAQGFFIPVWRFDGNRILTFFGKSLLNSYEKYKSLWLQMERRG